MASRYTIEDMHFFARQMGGRCLSKEYPGTRIPLAWMCKHGHTWDMRSPFIALGAWCPQCAKGTVKEERFEEIKQIAKSKGGECLTKDFVTMKTHMKFRCSQGHEWLSHGSNIKLGRWCKRCAGLERLTIEDMQNLAKLKGGKCLSEKYVNSWTKLKWQCKEGHVWMAIQGNIQQGAWCPECSYNRSAAGRRTDIKILKNLAVERGGKLLSKKYEHSQIKLKWQCAKGHKWMAKVGPVKLGGWCPVCMWDVIRRQTMDDISKYQKLANEHGGKLLSKVYHGSQVPLKWQCNEGHVWNTRPVIIAGGGWCPQCRIIERGKKQRSHIREFQDLAKSRGGKLISKVYTGSFIPLIWKCGKGHQWSAIAPSVKRGRWCPQCADSRRGISLRGDISELVRIAEKRGGRLISKKYVNLKGRLIWECKKKHRWEVSPLNIKYAGTWCPVCRKRN